MPAVENIYPLKMLPKNQTMMWGSEDWAVSVYPENESKIINGALAGRLAGEVLDDYPLLIKILKSRQTLSVQVHPNDVQAKSLENEPRGKTEAWVVLRADPGARLIFGLRENTDKEAFERAVRTAASGQDDIEGFLRWIEVSEGDVLFIPAGAVHALGAGMEVYEVQQSSNRTYRLWDWGRLDNGKPRELHTDKGIAVTNVSFSEGKCDGKRIAHAGYDEIIYIDEEVFTLKRFDIRSGREAPACFNCGGSVAALTMLGDGFLLSRTGEEPFKYGDTFIIPPELAEYRIVGDCSVICSYVRH